MLIEEGGPAFTGRNLMESRDTELASFVAVRATPGCKFQGKGNRCLVGASAMKYSFLSHPAPQSRGGEELWAWCS